MFHKNIFCLSVFVKGNWNRVINFFKPKLLALHDYHIPNEIIYEVETIVTAHHNEDIDLDIFLRHFPNVKTIETGLLYGIPYNVKNDHQIETLKVCVAPENQEKLFFQIRKLKGLKKIIIRPNSTGNPFLFVKNIRKFFTGIIEIKADVDLDNTQIIGI